MCKTCFDRMQNVSEEEAGSAHPQIISYAQERTPEEIAKMRAYESATPQTMPKLTWKKIGQKWYFLDNGAYWRYAADRSLDDTSYWRLIPEIKCPLCRNIDPRHQRQ
jgi:hypothetical protein